MRAPTALNDVFIRATYLCSASFHVMLAPFSNAASFCTGSAGSATSQSGCAVSSDARPALRRPSTRMRSRPPSRRVRRAPALRAPPSIRRRPAPSSAARGAAGHRRRLRSAWRRSPGCRRRAARSQSFRARMRRLHRVGVEAREADFADPVGVRSGAVDVGGVEVERVVAAGPCAGRPGGQRAVLRQERQRRGRPVRCSGAPGSRPRRACPTRRWSSCSICLPDSAR